MDLNTYLNQRFTCECGREHYASLRVVRVGAQALNELPVLVKLMGFQSVYLKPHQLHQIGRAHV